MSGKTDRRITFLSLTTAALPPDGSGGSLGAVCRAVVSVCIPKVPISSRDPSLFLWSSLFAALKSAKGSLLVGLKPLAFRPRMRVFGSYSPYSSYSPYLSSRNPRLILSSWNLASLSCLCGTCSVISSLSVMSAFSPFLATCPFLRAQATCFLTFVYIFRYGWAVGVRREYRAVGGSLSRRVKGKSLNNPLTACVSSLFVFYHLKIVGFLRILKAKKRSNPFILRLLMAVLDAVFLPIIFTSKLKDVCQTSIPTQP